MRAVLRSKTKEYLTWQGMKSRCFNERCAAFYKYGGRGITMCSEWRDSFDLFLAHIGKAPTLDHTIDRIDGTKNYEPGNVRWATRKEQQQNLRTNVWIEYQGRRMILFDWSKETGVDSVTLRHRLKRGWTVEEAMTTPPGGRPCDREKRIKVLHDGLLLRWARQKERTLYESKSQGAPA